MTITPAPETITVARADLSPAAQVIYNAVRFDDTTVPFGAIWEALLRTEFDPRGDLYWRATAWTNVYLWPGVNSDFIEWMRELTNPDILHLEAVSFFDYAYDGLPAPLHMPLVQAGDLPPLGGGLSEPHWLPVGLAMGPPRGQEGAQVPLALGTPHALYRFWGSSGTLLYIGLTLNPASRWANHIRDKPWWLEVHSITIEHFPDRQSVVDAEKAAIRAERPRYNVVHNRSRQPQKTR